MRKNTCLQSVVENVDVYGSKVELNYGKDKGAEFKSTWGCIGTVLVSVGTLLYLMVNALAVNGYKGTSVMTYIS